MLNRFDVLNTATKYPSIETYHVLGEKGRLTEKAMQFTGQVVLTEKVDGANARIIVDSDRDWVIGSREHLLAAKGDRVTNPTLSIVDTLYTVAEEHVASAPKGQIRVYYLEVYGSGIGAAAKQYASGNTTGLRLFDVAHLDTDVLDLTVEKASSWREHGGLDFVGEDELCDAAWGACVDRVPVVGAMDASALPQDLEGMRDWLQNPLAAQSTVRLDEGGKGQSEGIVIRTFDRSVIAKARIQDYNRTLGKGK